MNFKNRILKWYHKLEIFSFIIIKSHDMLNNECIIKYNMIKDRKKFFGDFNLIEMV